MEDIELIYYLMITQEHFNIRNEIYYMEHFNCNNNDDNPGYINLMRVEDDKDLEFMSFKSFIDEYYKWNIGKIRNEKIQKIKSKIK